MRDKDDYQSFADTLVTSGRENEHRDFHLAIAGVEAGQQQRFIPEENTPKAQQAKKEKQHVDDMTALMIRLLTDPVYKAYYNETMDMLAEAEKAADQAMAYFAAQRAETQRVLQEILESATSLKGHGAVFKDGDKVRLLDGTVIDDPDLLASIVWKEDSPTYTEAATQRDNAERFNASYEEAHRYRHDTLGNMRDTMEDEDNQVSTEDMEQIRDIITEQDLTFGAKELANNVSDLKQLPNVSMAASQPSL